MNPDEVVALGELADLVGCGRLAALERCRRSRIRVVSQSAFRPGASSTLVIAASDVDRFFCPDDMIVRQGRSWRAELKALRRQRVYELKAQASAAVSEARMTLHRDEARARIDGEIERFRRDRKTKANTSTSGGGKSGQPRWFPTHRDADTA